MRANYHTHTRRRGHAGGTEADYVQAALDNGLTALGFTDHCPLPGWEGLNCFRMDSAELPLYFAAVEEEARKHAGEITILKSVEVEYMPQYRDFLERLYTDWHVDYLLLGQHFFEYHGSKAFVSSTQDTELLPAYARSIREALRTGLFQMVAHPDLFGMRPYAWDRNCTMARDIILDAIAESGAVLEWNANGMRRGVQDFPDGPRVPYPHPRFWDPVPGSGIPVAVGADCHDPKCLWDDAVVQSYHVLQDMGIEPISTFPLP